jgi:hypothetical protein
MTQDMKDLERDIEETRARLDLTIDRLQDKLSVSGVVDDLVGSMRTNGYGPAYDRVLDTIRRNPIPVMLVAAGVGWLIYRMGNQPARSHAAMPLPYDEPYAPALRPREPRVYEPQLDLVEPDVAPLVPGVAVDHTVEAERDIASRPIGSHSSKEISHG